MDPFVSPMALALSWGLIFSTVITLIVIPAVFAIGRMKPANAVGTGKNGPPEDDHQ